MKHCLQLFPSCQMSNIFVGQAGTKILNITTQGGKVISTSSRGPNVVTVNPKTLHLTAVKSGAGGSKSDYP